MARIASGEGARPLGYEAHALYALICALLELRDVALADGLAAVGELRRKIHVLVRDGQDPARYGEDVRHPPHGLVEGVRHPVQGREEEIAEALALQAALRKAVGEQLLHDGLGVREGLDAVAHVARGRHPEVGAEHAAAAAVVGDRDDGRYIARELL